MNSVYYNSKGVDLNKYTIHFLENRISGHGSYDHPKILEINEDEMSLDDIKESARNLLAPNHHLAKKYLQILYEKRILGPNYGKMPGFSFGTPVIDIIHPDFPELGKIKLGVGHSKIHQDQNKFKYISGSKIDLFRQNLHNDMKTYFGKSYVPHYGTFGKKQCDGYIYMMYFYFLFDEITVDGTNNKKYQKAMISDSYLPVTIDLKMDSESTDYKFSLVFPMGIGLKNENVVTVTCGYGDYKSIALEFDLKVIINSCIHDIQNVDMDEYQYFTLVKKDGTNYLSSKLSNIL
jgi:hypothetical protein